MFEKKDASPLALMPSATDIATNANYHIVTENVSGRPSIKIDKLTSETES
jgi:hypothetical protein